MSWALGVSLALWGALAAALLGHFVLAVFLVALTAWATWAELS